MAAKSFLVTMKEFFGFRQGQTLTGFQAEVKEALGEKGTEEYKKNRAEWVQMFATVGIEVAAEA